MGSKDPTGEADTRGPGSSPQKSCQLWSNPSLLHRSLIQKYDGDLVFRWAEALMKPHGQESSADFRQAKLALLPRLSEPMRGVSEARLTQAMVDLLRPEVLYHLIGRVSATLEKLKETIERLDRSHRRDQPPTTAQTPATPRTP